MTSKVTSSMCMQLTQSMAHSHAPTVNFCDQEFIHKIHHKCTEMFLLRVLQCNLDYPDPTYWHLDYLDTLLPGKCTCAHACIQWVWPLLNEGARHVCWLENARNDNQ